MINQSRRRPRIVGLLTAAVVAAPVIGVTPAFGGAPAPESVAALTTSAAITPGPLTDCGLVAEGDTGRCVELLQAALNDTGAPYGLVEDGVFGAGTRVALLDFQGRNGLGADGLAGPEVLSLLAETGAAVSGGSVASPRPQSPCPEGTVRHNGECYNPEWIGRSNLLGKSVVECADEATRKAVKKILKEETLGGKARQTGNQLGKKLRTVPEIFKCALWDIPDR